MKLQKKRVKKLTDEELQKSVDDQEILNTSRTTPFALHTWQAWLEHSDFESKSIEEFAKEEHPTFPHAATFFTGKFVQQREKTSNHLT